MGTEIERRFLVTSRSWMSGSQGGIAYRQGYLSVEPARTVRVRRAGDKGVLTIKGISAGARRAEFEWEIPQGDADELLDTLALRPLIEKTRHRVRHGAHVWEIDVFAGENSGLVIAEVELEREDEDIVVPDWVGLEVTGDHRYSNASLVRAPWPSWSGSAG